MTPENLRYHAAGHLAAAHILATQGMGAAARAVLLVIKTFVGHPTVDAPPALKDKLDACIVDPVKNSGDIAILEQWFVDPLNTAIEANGGKF